MEHSDPDAKIKGTDLSDSGGNCDDGQARGNVDWALWDENKHDFCKILFHASSDYKPQNGHMPVSPHDFLMFFKEMAPRISRCLSADGISWCYIQHVESFIQDFFSE